jgi:hypothetical protein
MEKVIKPKTEKKPKEVIEYFTDEMGKNIYPFQDKISKRSTPVTSTLTFKTGKRK